MFYPDEQGVPNDRMCRVEWKSRSASITHIVK